MATPTNTPRKLYQVSIPNMAAVCRIVGRVTKDAEARMADQSGNKVTNISAAFSRRYNHNNEWKEVAQFISVAVWGDDAATRAQNIKKGDVIFVEFSAADMQARVYQSNGESKGALQVNRATVARFAWSENGSAAPDVEGVPSLAEGEAVTPEGEDFPF